MTDIEVRIDLESRTRQVGLLRRTLARDTEIVTFEYAETWLADPDRFPIGPALPLTPGIFTPRKGQRIFGSLGDSAPDNWGRALMQRRERSAASHGGRTVRTLREGDYLLGVADQTRLGALRFREPGNDDYLAPLPAAAAEPVPLEDLLQATGSRPQGGFCGTRKATRICG